MNRILFALTIASSLIVAGCGEGEDPQPTAQSPAPHVPTVAEYRQILEKRISSTDGANINVRQEIGKFEKASDADKISMYKKVKDLAK